MRAQHRRDQQLHGTLTGGDQRIRILTNCRRQLEVPAVMLPGATSRLMHYALKPPAIGDHTAIAVIGAGRQPVPLTLPFGRLFVDPASLVTLPAVPAPAIDGVGVLTLPLPANPSLTGATLYFQAVSLADLDPLNSLRLTNAVRTTVR